ncbi:MAG: 30S ribosomal protein S1 [Ruminococcaceae bacterium]|nr:30S ribosomal protein S1 [Oscillospiraceae bacterium]
MNSYCPEGELFGTVINREYTSSLAGLERAMNEGLILEGNTLLCDSSMRLHVDLYGIRGIIPKEEALFCKSGEEIKDIALITRVGKPTCFKVIGFEKHRGETVAILSRRAAQAECIRNYLSSLTEGDIIPARVTHLESFGAFVDIGCGISSLLSVDSISVSRISHPSDRLSVGDKIFTAVKTIDRLNGRIFVSMRELLGTWEENASLFEAGQTVSGIIRSVESYGVFVELAPNLAGLAEIRDTDTQFISERVGKYAAVYIKNIIPDKMKIKLVLIDANGTEAKKQPINYFVDCERVTHMDRWQYSPDGAQKLVGTVFGE